MFRLTSVFTGIIEFVGGVTDVRPAADGGRSLQIDVGPLTEGLTLGDSVAVDGVCLTAAEIAGSRARFDAVAETISRSTLGGLRPGAKVNLERAMPADGRFDGHIVQGHVDGQATVVDVHRGGDWRIRLTAEAELIGQLVPKGSIAVSGVSLTIADLTNDGFSVAVIPTTLAETTLKDFGVGEKVNIELDVIGKYVKRVIQQMFLDNGTAQNVSSGGLTMESLKKAGFV